MDPLAKLQARRDALALVLRGGVEIVNGSEIEETRARIVYEWLVSEAAKVEAAIAAITEAA